MKSFICLILIIFFINIHPMQQSSQAAAAAQSSSPGSLEKKINRLSKLLEQGVLEPAKNDSAADKDKKQLELLFKNLKFDFKSGEESETSKSVSETYDVLNSFSNQELVNTQWANTRLYFLTIAEAKRILSENDMLAARNQRVDKKILVAYIANFQQARANQLVTEEFDLAHYKKSKYRNPKKDSARSEKK